MALPFNISNSMIHDLKIGEYAACAYEFDWYTGIILDISIDNGDVYVKFMHSKVRPCFLNGLRRKMNAGLKTTKSNQSGRKFTFDENGIKDVISMKNYFFTKFSFELFILSYFKTMFKIILNSFPLIFQDMKAIVDFVIHRIRKR